MNMNIILFEKNPTNGIIPISDYRAQHILNILKLKKNDYFYMGIINKSQGIARIISIDENEIRIEYSSEETPKAFPITLIVAQVRPICMKRILREATCLGVKKIIITGAETTEKSYSNAKIWKEEEYKEFLLAGAMQSGQSTIPNVVLVSSVQNAVDSDDSNIKFILDNKGKSVKQFSDIDFLSKTIQNVSIAIGPERGWTDREREIFQINDYQCIEMGKRIMRTETAVPASLCLLLSSMGLL